MKERLPIPYREAFVIVIDVPGKLHKVIKEVRQFPTVDLHRSIKEIVHDPLTLTNAGIVLKRMK